MPKEISKIESAWEKAEPVPGRDPHTWRKDTRGKLIRKRRYGHFEEYGWELERIVPLAQGGTNDHSNLRAVNWEDARKDYDY